MEAKEKAQELIEKFKVAIIGDNGHLVVVSDKDAKILAEKAVEEILSLQLDLSHCEVARKDHALYEAVKQELNH